VARPARLVYRGLARLLPASFRAGAGGELEAAAMACLDRERARWGVPGLAYGWLRVTADTAVAAVVLRWHAFARRGVVAGAGGGRGAGLEGFVDHLGRDVRQAWRTLRRQPGFAAVAVLTLALGLGANTAVFSVVHGVLWRPLPYPEPHQLHRITTRFPNQFDSPFPFSPPEFTEFRDHTRAYRSVGGYYIGAANLGAGTPERPVRALVTPELLPTLGVEPAHGRVFTVEDSRPGASDVAILTWALWQRLNGGDPAAIGRQVPINDVPAEIVGVMPPGFDIQDRRVEVLQPLTVDPAAFPTSRAEHYLYLIGRLADDVTAAQARADADRLQREWTTVIAPGAHAPNDDHHPLLIQPLDTELVAEARLPLLLLQGAVLLVLLVACANLASLFLARADSRLREYAVRTALGASGRQLFRHMLVEGLMLTVAGAAAGLVLARAGLGALLAVNPEAVPRAGEIGLDWTVLAFTTAAAGLAALAMTLVPFLRLRSPRLAAMASESGSRGVAGGRAAGRSLLVVAEVALAVTLVAGAGLLIRSVWNLTHVDVGFDRADLTAFSVVLPGASYDVPARAAFAGELTDRVRAIPGVERVATMTGLPPLRAANVTDTDFEHIPNERPHGEPPIENVDFYQTVSLDYIDTMGIRMATGRPFEARDVGGEPVVLINQTLADAFFPGRESLGARVKPPWGGGVLPWFTVVGVVQDVRQGGLGEAPGTELYFLSDQLVRVANRADTQRSVVVRSTRSTASLAPELRAAVAELDPRLPVIGLRSMDAVIDESIAEPRFLALLLSLFAGLALALAAVGTYGVLSFLVTERRREFGIRLALGAERRRILRLVVRRGMVLLVAGLAIGLAGAAMLGRLAETMLFGVTASDPLTLAGVAVVLLAVGLAACLVPASRATRVDPLTALRDA
jgi:predicted permease